MRISNNFPYHTELSIKIESAFLLKIIDKPQNGYQVIEFWEQKNFAWSKYKRDTKSRPIGPLLGSIEAINVFKERKKQSSRLPSRPN